MSILHFIKDVLFLRVFLEFEKQWNLGFVNAAP